MGGGAGGGLYILICGGLGQDVASEPTSPISCDRKCQW